jgi:Spy/CpxP family protein refolding chaperone
MRKLLLVAALAALMATPILAQRGRGRPRGGFRGGELFILTNKGVQKELKFTDKQKAQLQKIQKASFETFRKAREAGEDGDKDKAQEIIKKGQEATAKAVKSFKAGLNTAQAKRLGQIQVQMAGLRAFAREDVQKALKLTDKQKDQIKDLNDDLAKAMKDIREEAGGDFRKMRGMMKKIRTLQVKAMTKVTKSFSTDQQEAWKELTGKPFEFRMEFGRRPGGRKPKPKPDE